jgi:hypothetical protein
MKRLSTITVEIPPRYKFFHAGGPFTLTPAEIKILYRDNYVIFEGFHITESNIIVFTEDHPYFNIGMISNLAKFYVGSIPIDIKSIDQLHDILIQLPKNS